MISYLKYLFVTVLLIGSFHAFAATGVIDPSFYTAQVCESGTCDVTATSPVNFGVFSFSPSSNVSITDTELRGFIWGKSFGYAVLNCLDVVASGGGPGGCVEGVNGNFRVANTTSGHLSGYAWGETAGWINFGPFTQSATPSVVINSQGEFNGYAWAQNFGWIKFDCTSGSPDFPAYCVKTDWRPVTTPSLCTDPTANNFNGPLPCDYGGGGGLCTDPGATNYLSGTPCTYPTICKDINATNYNGALPCEYPVRYCEDQSALNYLGFLPCTYPPTLCMDRTADNFGGLAPCTYPSNLCNDRTATNFGSPLPCRHGGDSTLCLDPSASNYNSPGTCIYPPILCIDSRANNYNLPAPCTYSSNPTLCTDPVATNYNRNAPCRYPSTVVDPSGSTCVGIACIVGGPLFNTTTQLVAPIGLFFGLALALANSLFANPITFSEIFIIPARLWALLFIKRRYKPWGVVYDSVTKQPLDPAYVVLQDLQGNEIATCITDLDGRYGFLVPAGDYRMIANKTNYEFPSKKLAGKTSDELYSDLYFNEIVTVKEGEVIIKNIPMDPLKFDWNEFAKQDQKLMKFYSKRDLWIARISRILFYFGFILTTAAVIVSPILYNIVIFFIYIILFIFQHTILRPRPFGSITYNGAPLAFAIIKVFSVANNREVVKKVSTQIGRYYCLVPNGTYYLTIERKNADATYTLVHTSSVINVTEGYINKKFKI